MFLIHLALSAALAQDAAGGAVPDLNAQNFRPTIDGQRTLWTDDSARGPDKQFMARGLFHYTHNPLVYEFEDGETLGLVSSIVQADVLAGWSIDRFRIGLDLPVYLYQAGDQSQNGAGLGDIALDGKVTILDDKADGDSGAPIGLAVNARINLPTATTAAPLGNNSLGWEASAIVDKRIKKTLIAANIGVLGANSQALENVTLNDYLSYRLAGGYAITEKAGASLEFGGKVNLAEPGNSASNPLEWLAGGYGRLSDNLLLRGGFGTGITPGIGSPDFRLILGVGWEPQAEKEPVIVDSDGDGLMDPDDQCPTEAEDKDGFEDADGCPDADNDGDGILDADDQCMNEAEDKDGDRDEDGCPDGEIATSLMLVDAESGEAIGVGRINITGDGYKKGSADASVDLRLAPGTYNVTGIAAGYEEKAMEVVVKDAAQKLKIELTPKKDAKVVVTRDRIDLKDKVYFNTAKATIQSKSFGLLDEAVQILKDYPEIKKLRIEGHTDSRGAADYNLKLSKDRAASVRQYFIDKGIAADRLTSEGFGETKPLDSAATQEAYAKNRRVDFFIETWEAIPQE